MHLTETIMLGFSLLEWQSWVVILQVALGLSAVIFVHELGHFLVAKACGVKCEKFYIGFDVGGAKLFKFQWGETEYGIGALPLGGYVKMLGQEDNPARVAEELERAKLSGEVGEEGAFKLDPRSYLAQSVPERMAIISAGVIMNVIFAVVFASIAYGLGVEIQSCAIGSVLPGEAAWQAGLRPGDRVLAIDGKPAVGFSDLMKNVALGDIEDGVQMQIERPGVPEPFTIVVRPERKQGTLAPRIGAGPPQVNRLHPKQATIAGTPAATALPAFEPGDTIVAINGQPIKSYPEIEAVLTRKSAETIEFTVERKKGKLSEESVEKLSIPLPPNPIKWIGVETEMGAILAVQADSPAAMAGIKAGDQLLSIDGQPPGNPLTLPDRLRALAGQQVTLQLKRSGEAKPLNVDVEPRDPPWHEVSLASGAPLSAPALGIAYRVGARIVAVEPGSPAEKGGLKPGDVVQSARVIQPKDLDLDKSWHDERETTLDFSEDQLNWPRLFFLTQRLAPGSKIVLVLDGGREVELEPIAAQDWYFPERGLLYYALTSERKANSFGEAVRLGWEETKDSLLLVVRFLQKVGRQISFKSAGGPGTIFVYAAASAEAGMSQFLLFLCMLSANLAVINFLPIPVLDGGHMVFLAYEGITGKPLNEKWFVRLTYAGLLFILLLMIFVLGLDIDRFVTWIQSWRQ